MDFQPADENVIRAVNQRWLLKYWTSLRGAAKVPAWSKIDPLEIRSSMESTILHDVIADNGSRRFLIRYQGAQIVRTYGADCTGKFFDEVLPPIVRDTTLAVYRQAASGGLPVYTISEARDGNRHPVQHERLLLPFAENGERVDRIMGCIEYVSRERKFDQRDLMTSQPVPPAYSLSAVIGAR